MQLSEDVKVYVLNTLGTWDLGPRNRSTDDGEVDVPWVNTRTLVEEKVF